jgi:thioesterase domain-containing protein
LGEDQPVLGLRVPASEFNRFRVPFKIEEGAKELVRSLREAQPEGPYHLAGLCINGLVAYEMARQLACQGQQVGLLALFDVPAPSHAPSASAAQVAVQPPTKLEQLWSELLHGGAKGLIGFTQRRGKAVARRLKLLRWRVQQSLGFRINLNKILNDPDAVEQPSNYFSKPKPYAGPLTFFQSDDCEFEEANWKSSIGAGWQVRRVAGGHVTMFAEEYAASTASSLSECLKLTQSDACRI